MTWNFNKAEFPKNTNVFVACDDGVVIMAWASEGFASVFKAQDKWIAWCDVKSPPHPGSSESTTVTDRRIRQLEEALHNLVKDLEMRANGKVVDASHGFYMTAKRVLEAKP